MFQFKQFTIQQGRTAMKVGTDGVLLGAWANIENAKNILDIGTGTGVIALMSAQRNRKARIDAIEIEPDAFQQACDNVSVSPWKKTIQIFQCALQDFDPDKSYDTIICNPPFFNHSTPTPTEARTLARHSVSLSHTELLKHATELLAPDGNFCVVLPTAEAISLIDEAIAFQLYPARITKVLPTPEKAPKRFLISFVRTQTTTLNDNLIVELSRHNYSEEYIRLTKDFYLHF